MAVALVFQFPGLSCGLTSAGANRYPASVRGSVPPRHSPRLILTRTLTLNAAEESESEERIKIPGIPDGLWKKIKGQFASRAVQEEHTRQLNQIDNRLDKIDKSLDKIDNKFTWHGAFLMLVLFVMGLVMGRVYA